MSEAPAFLRLNALDDDLERVRQRLISQLRRAQLVNARQESYYEGSRAVRDLGISIPPHLRDVEAVAAWPEIVVDVMDERMDWRGWYTDDDADNLGLGDVYDENHLEVEAGQATLDALLFGLTYMVVGTGEASEPDVLVTAESPKSMTATWDRRQRRATEALTEITDAFGRVTGWKLYVPGLSITTERINSKLVITDYDETGRDRIPVSVLRNRPRGSRTDGRSEITRAVRSLTDSGMRTLLGMEVAREFYGVAQRYLLGADESMFVDMDGNRKSIWDVMMGKALALPRDEDGNLPTVGQFQASSPQPFTEILKTYSQMISAATGIPATHLGFTTDNPASADAIQRADGRLDKRAIRRQKQYDIGLIDLGELVVLWRDGALPPAGAVKSLWLSPSTPTPAAAADRAGKMIASGALDPSWDFTLEQYGLSDAEIRRVRQERLRTAGRANIAALASAAEAARTDPQVVELSGISGAGNG